MKYLFILFLMGFFGYCYADMVCIEKSTGKLIEYQSSATKGTLTENAINQGYKKKDIEEREVSQQEWLIIKEEKIDKPAKEKEKEKEQKQKEKEILIKQKLSLTDNDFANLKEALGK